jgi:SAM-dependent methyltransferase
MREKGSQALSSGDDAVIVTGRAYEQDARAWAGREREAGERSARHGRFASLLRAGARVLDLGCGPGSDSDGLAARGMDVVGLDLTRAMLEIAASRVPCGLIQADGRCLPLRSATFDGVWASASLLHLPKSQVGLALAEVRRVLRWGGAFYSAMKAGNADGLMITRPDVVRSERHFAHYAASDWSGRVEAAGFAIDSQAIEDEGAVLPDTPWIVTYAIAR